MDAEISENLFSSYLKSNKINYERHFKVCNDKNVDFKITEPKVIFCDVKEVHDSIKHSFGTIDAWSHIREDINSLRKKFGKKKYNIPIVLITMNFSSNYFTSHTVAQAMFGDVGVNYLGNEHGEMFHLPRGNASMTRSTNTSISGVFVFDCVNLNHVCFYNEFAKNPIPKNFFPNAREIYLKRNANENSLNSLPRITFWERDQS